MQNIHKTRFLAANYTTLQGLKAVPLGLLLITVVLWANTQTGRASDLSLPILFALAAALLTWAIYRYYRVRYGKVVSRPWKKRLEFVLGLAGGAIAFAAFVLDTLVELPVSLIGLVFAGSIVFEYLRMQWYAPGHYLLPVTLVCFAFMLLVSILPLFGAGDWWQLFGIRAQLFAVLLAAGAMIVLFGFVEHWFFVRHLPGAGGER